MNSSYFFFWFLREMKAKVESREMHEHQHLLGHAFPQDVENISIAKWNSGLVGWMQ